MDNILSAGGLVVLIFLAWCLSVNRRAMNWRLILSGLALQFVFAFLVLKTGPGKWLFERARDSANLLTTFSDAGATFVFGEGFREHFIAFAIPSTIILVSSLMAVLFHLGVLQVIVEVMARIMVRVMDTSGTESIAAAANIFSGQTEAPLTIKPYLPTMTRSELMALMVGGMATVAGGVLIAYAQMGADAGHLLAASIISAPAGLLIAKIIYPETEKSPSKGHVRVEVPKLDQNVLDAACRGASEGMQLSLNVVAMLIAFTALVAMANHLVGIVSPWVGFTEDAPLTIQTIVGALFAPMAWVMGVTDWTEAQLVGRLLGEKMVLNEFVAYLSLTTPEMKAALSERSFTIATYALCGFANFASIAIQIGGIGGLVPERRKDFAQLGLRAMLGGTLAANMTACIAGVLI